LLSQGHIGATRYPIAYLWNEVRFTRNRLNAVMVSEAVVMKATISQAIWGGKELRELLEKLDGD
jgi:hypothetical protein